MARVHIWLIRRMTRVHLHRLRQILFRKKRALPVGVRVLLLSTPA